MGCGYHRERDGDGNGKAEREREREWEHELEWDCHVEEKARIIDSKWSPLERKEHSRTKILGENGKQKKTL